MEISMAYVHIGGGYFPNIPVVEKKKENSLK